jgi:hypothetical protein
MMAGCWQAQPRNSIRDFLGLTKWSQKDDFIGAWLVEAVL